MQKAGKCLKPCQVGTYRRVLSEIYLMNTNTTGFRRFSKFCILVLWRNVALALEGLPNWCLQRLKAAGQFGWYQVGKSKMEKIFEGEMLDRTLPTTLFRIFCKIMLNFQVIIKSIEDPDEDFKGVNGLTKTCRKSTHCTDTNSSRGRTVLLVLSVTLCWWPWNTEMSVHLRLGQVSLHIRHSRTHTVLLLALEFWEICFTVTVSATLG